MNVEIDSNRFAGIGVTDLAGLQRHRVRSQRSRAQCRREARDELIVAHVTVQQQHLDQGAGTVLVTVRFACSSPPRIMNGGEFSCRSCLFESGRTGFAEKPFQVVIEIEPGR